VAAKYSLDDVGGFSEKASFCAAGEAVHIICAASSFEIRSSASHLCGISDLASCQHLHEMLTLSSAPTGSPIHVSLLNTEPETRVKAAKSIADPVATANLVSEASLERESTRCYSRRILEYVDLTDGPPRIMRRVMYHGT